MDTILSKSTILLSKPRIFPVRTASQASFSSLASIASSSKSLNLHFSTGSRRHRNQLGCRFPSQFRKLSVTCGSVVQEIDETQFSDSVLKSDCPVLVEFVANWCGPCRLISPVIEWVAQVSVVPKNRPSCNHVSLESSENCSVPSSHPLQDREYKDRLTVVKIHHDANPKLIEEYKVYGLPTLILFKNGKEVPESRREGVITNVKLKEYLDALLESISVV